MKKLIYCLSFLATIGFISCGDDDTNNCDLLTFTQRSDANLVLGQAYTTEMSKENCDAYKADLDAIVADYDSCEDTVISTQVAALKVQSESLDCQ